MRGDAVQLAQHHPDDPGSFRNFDPEQPLHGRHVGQLVEERRQVVHPSDEGDALLPRSPLAVLLDAGVQVTDDRTARHDVLTVELEDQAEDPVGRGVLGPHVDDHGLLVDPLVVFARHVVRRLDRERRARPIAHHIPRSSTGGMNAPL